MSSFKAFRIHEENKKIVARFEQLTLDDLAAGDVVVRVTYSDINYKDALAATGAGKILRRYPLVGGIDFAGVVESSNDARYSKGDSVLVTGCALSETHDGGYSEYMLAPVEALVSIPDSLSDIDAAPLVCAGVNTFNALRRAGALPGDLVAVQGIGGLGHLGIQFANKFGYNVAAVGRGSHIESLAMKLGADVYIDKIGRAHV